MDQRQRVQENNDPKLGARSSTDFRFPFSEIHEKRCGSAVFRMWDGELWRIHLSTGSTYPRILQAPGTVPLMEYVGAEEMFELVHGRRSDDSEWFRFGDVMVDPDDIVSILAPAMSTSRQDTVERVLDGRTANLTVVVDGMVDMGNVSAVIRTADGFGVQSVHAIDTADVYKRSRRTTRGTDKWVDRYRWGDIESCLSHLRSQRYRIVVADITKGAVPIGELDLTERSAFVFGNELKGVSHTARDMADVAATIPMAGFADSFNISVAASITLYEAQRQRRIRFGRSGDLSESDKTRIRAVWYLKSVRESRLHIERALANGYGATGTE